MLWKNGTVRDLGTLAGDTSSSASAINNRGLIVGYSNSRAVVWRDGTVTDLNSLLPANSGWELVSAKAINNRGEIVGYGEHNGQRSSNKLA